MSAGVIFDVDGTLFDTNEMHARSWQETFRQFGYDFPIEELRRQIGKGADQYMPVFLSKEDIAKIGEQLEEFRAELFKTKYLPKAQPFPKVRELLQRLQADGYKIALASSAKQQDLDVYCERACIGEFLAGQTTADDVKHSKPEPDIFKAALDKLGGVTADRAVVVGDSPFDVQAAAKLNLRVIGVLCGGFGEDRLRDAGAIAIYRGPADMLERYDTLPLP